MRLLADLTWQVKGGTGQMLLCWLNFSKKGGAAFDFTVLSFAKKILVPHFQEH